MFKGKLVKLTAYKKEDMPIIKEYLNKFEIRSNLTPAIPYPYKLEDEYKWYENNSANNEIYSFAIETLKEKKVIGGCGINNIDRRNSYAEVGIFIGDENFLGKGYGTDAMKILIKFIFEEVNVNKVKLGVYSFNERAKRSYEKCGLKIEGVLREEIYRGGKYYDVISMGILRREYEENKVYL